MIFKKLKTISIPKVAQDIATISTFIEQIAKNIVNNEETKPYFEKVRVDER